MLCARVGFSDIWENLLQDKTAESNVMTIVEQGVRGRTRCRQRFGQRSSEVPPAAWPAVFRGAASSLAGGLPRCRQQLGQRASEVPTAAWPGPPTRVLVEWLFHRPSSKFWSPSRYAAGRSEVVSLTQPITS